MVQDRVTMADRLKVVCGLSINDS